MGAKLRVDLDAVDNASGVFERASSNAKKLAGTGKDIGDAFDVAGRVATQFGNSALSSAIGGMEGMINASARLTGGLQGNKLALAGMAGSALALGIAVAGVAYEFTAAAKAAKQLETNTKFNKELEELEIKTAEATDRHTGAVARINKELVDNVNAVVAASEKTGWFGQQVGWLGGRAGYTAEQIKTLTAEYGKLATAQKAAVQQQQFDASAQKAIEASKQRMAGEQRYFEQKKTWQKEINDNAGRDVDDKFTREQQLYEAQREWGAELLTGYEREVEVAGIASQKRMQQIEEARQSGIDVDEAATNSILLYYAQMGDAEANQYERMRRIQIEDKNRKLQLQQQYVQGASTMFGNLAETAKAFGKKGFAAFKAFATAQALVNTYSSAVGAYNAMVSIPYVGPALAVAAAAAAVAAGLANVAQINSQNPNVAHAGIENVPEESTYLLQQGERVVQPKQNTQLGEFLDRNAGGYGGGGDVYLDGRKVGKVLFDMMRGGSLKIHAGAIV